MVSVTSSKTLLLFAIVAASALSGCFGSGETLEATAMISAFDPVTGEPIVDPATGQPISNVQIVFHPGTGDSGLGLAFERAVLKAGINQTVEVTTRASFTEQAARERVFGPAPAVLEAGYSEWTQALGEPTVGAVIQEDRIFPFPVRIEAVKPPVAEDVEVERTNPETNQTETVTESRVVEPGTVTYRYIPENGARTPVALVGGELVTYVEGDQITQVLEPTPGATFSVARPPPGQTAVLGLQPGYYRTVGANATHIFYEYGLIGVPALFDSDVSVHATLQSVTSTLANPTPPAGPNYGVRDSPQLKQLPALPAGGHDHGDHDHGGHEH